jgi:BirA family transcriptional regulator, biotin operon repressor / biotin---[acetyl-CoA-carboxylase] ligase
VADHLTSKVIERSLTGRFGMRVRHVRVTGSTNADAFEWAEAGAPEGALIVADQQTAGRGRWGRSWRSDPGSSLMFSIVLRPEAPAGSLHLLTTALGLACCYGIDSTTSIATHLKWPNDVTVGGRKLAGILVESRVSENRIDFAVAGVGINVSWRTGEVPDEISARATSIAIEMERLDLAPPPPRLEILKAILAALETLYPAPSDLLEQASARSEILGREVVVRRADGRTLSGRARRLAPTGALELDVDGDVVVVHSGEVDSLRAMKPLG